MKKPKGSDLSSSEPRCVRISYLYSAPSPTSGTNSSHTPEPPRACMACLRPSQLLKLPTTLTRCGIRRPDGEMRAGDAVADARVRAELVVEAVVTAFAEQIEVEVRQFVREEIGVVLDDHVIERKAHAQPVRHHRPAVRNAAFEQARVVDALERMAVRRACLPRTPRWPRRRARARAPRTAACRRRAGYSW